VEEIPACERLRRAREARGEKTAALSRRIGVGERLLVAIDEGRLGDLPTGIYARTAIRLYATALSLDADEILGECEALLPSADDQLAALARLRGLKPAAVPKSPAPPRGSGAPAPPFVAAPFPAWRPLAAVALDGCVIAALLVIAIAAAVPTAGVATSALGRAAAPVFGLLGVILATFYFLFFGGIACATAGERLIGMRVGRRKPRHIEPRTAMTRALRCAGRDVRYLMRLGAWAGHAMSSGSADERSQQGAPSIGHATGQ
jgi:hypothetical protein